MNDLCYHVYKPIPFGHKEEVRCLLCNEVVVGAPFAVDETNCIYELWKCSRPMVIHDLVQHSDIAHATYVYLEGSDAGFRHDRIDDYVTLYRALDDDRVVGFMVGDR